MFASSGQRNLGTAAEIRAPMPPSATIGGPVRRRSTNGWDVALPMNQVKQSTANGGWIKRSRVVQDEELQPQPSSGRGGRPKALRRLEPAVRGELEESRGGGLRRPPPCPVSKQTTKGLKVRRVRADQWRETSSSGTNGNGSWRESSADGGRKAAVRGFASVVVHDAAFHAACDCHDLAAH